MQNAILLHNKHWEGKPFNIAVKRKLLNKLLKFHNTKEISIITGIRRSGKSSLLKLYINELIKTENTKSILFINFDDPSFFEVYQNPEKIYSVIEAAETITQTKVKFLFLDEIQNINGWEKFIKSVYDAEKFKKICITGSNSKLLNSNYSGLLSGRYVKNQIYPFSLFEILKHNKIESKLAIIQNKSFVLNVIENMIKFGAFPEIISKPDEQIKHEILLNYFDGILIKDCIINKNIRDNKSFKNLSFYLFKNIAALFSYSSLAKTVEISDISVKEYIETMKDAFLIYEISQFSYKIKKQIKSKRKIYTIDNGLINAVSLNFSENKGKLFENLVYTELVKLGFDDIFMFNENKECDFIIKTKDKLIAVQATYEINSSNKKRELEGINFVNKKFNIAKSYIVTFLQSEKVSKTTSIIPIYELDTIIN